MSSEKPKFSLLDWLNRPVLRSKRTYGGAVLVTLALGAFDYLNHNNLAAALRFAALILAGYFACAFLEVRLPELWASEKENDGHWPR